MAHEFEVHDGLSCVTNNQSTAAINLVFVHGLGGGGYSTWFCESPSPLGFWPEVFGNEHPQCCVWTVHYTAKILELFFQSAPTMDLLDRAAWLLEELVQKDVSSKPIVFVAHSLGGVVVKQALQLSSVLGSPRLRPVWEQTRAVFFLATPHVGSGLANIAALLANALRNAQTGGGMLMRPSKALKNLEKNNPPLRYLTEWYKDQASAHGIETRAFSEQRAYRGTFIVDEMSASPQVTGCVTCPLPDDHISVAKPSVKTHLVYQGLSEYVRDVKKVIAGAGGIRSQRAVDLVSGAWWERITREGDPTAISFCEISFNSVTNQMAIVGYGFSADGSGSAEWRSVLGSISEEDRQLVMRYHWTGKILIKKGTGKNPEYNGYGVINFWPPASPALPISYAKGFYWNVDETNPANTSYKDIELKRIMDGTIVRTMQGSHDRDKQVCAAQVLTSWDTF